MIKPPRIPAIADRPGWETRWQLTLIEPAVLPPEEADELIRARPRLNVVVSNVPATHDNARETAATFIDQVKSTLPGLKLKNDGKEIAFKDGARGIRQDLSFVAGGVELLQAHIFRIDRGVATQIVVTSEIERSKQEFESIVDDVLGFSPELE